MQQEQQAKFRKNAFTILLIISFGTIFIFNYFTPMMTDDYSYAAQVSKAHSEWDLLLQEAHQYMTWNGRSVAHIILRNFLSIPTIIFKVCNSLVFVALSLFMLAHIKGRKKLDAFLLLVITIGLWLFTVDFSQTILWETGACNYLWGTTIILAFMTLMKYKKESFLEGKGSKVTSAKGIALLLGAFFFGVLAGWCNENTSGGCFLFLLLLIADTWRKEKKVAPFQISGAIGNLVGLMIMVLAPGNAIGASFNEENHSGLLGLAARFQKATLAIHEHFYILLVIVMITIVITVLKKKKEGVQDILVFLSEQLVFVFLFFASSYALILTSEPQPRAYFGAGIFLLIAVVQGISNVVGLEKEEEKKNLQDGKGNSQVIFRAVVYSGVLALSLHLFFLYMDCGANLARVYRDSATRVATIEEQKAQGSQDITVYQLHPDFDNPYTVAYESDLVEDPTYWTNVAYETYFEVPSIRAIPYPLEEE